MGWREQLPAGWGRKRGKVSGDKVKYGTWTSVPAALCEQQYPTHTYKSSSLRIRLLNKRLVITLLINSISRSLSAARPSLARQYTFSNG